VVVAPDLGAVTLVERFAAPFGLRVVVVRKSRITGAGVRAEEVVGDVEGCQLVTVDDMIATGATIEAAACLLVARGALPHVVVAATHGLLVDPAPGRLARLDLARLLVTDTVPVPPAARGGEVCSVTPLLSDVIGRLHREEPIGSGVAGDHAKHRQEHGGEQQTPPRGRPPPRGPLNRRPRGRAASAAALHGRVARR